MKSSPTIQVFNRFSSYIPLGVALLIIIGAGTFFLNRADEQARDTIRKHHIEDIERSLYADRLVKGTYPPYDSPTWCGALNDPKNKAVEEQVEAGLRKQHEKYANPAKPFPSDPSYAGTDKDYFYWKRSPSSFELYSVLEQDPNGDRSTILCNNASSATYDYGVASIWREDTLGVPL